MTEHVPFKVTGVADDLPAVQPAMRTPNRPSFRAQLYLTLLHGLHEAGHTSPQLEDVEKLFKPRMPAICIKTPQYYREQMLTPIDGGNPINTKRESGEGGKVGLLGSGLTLFYYGEDAANPFEIRGIGIRRLDGLEYLGKPDFINFVLSDDKFPSVLDEDKLLEFFIPIDSQLPGELGVIRSRCPICALDGSGDVTIARDSTEWGSIG
ncbi:hypothetical protein HK104_002512, partial [Borealophlyctis nickersoniae]